MKIVKRVWKLLLLCLMGAVISGNAAFAREPKEVKVVFTHDLHSHLEPFIWKKMERSSRWEALPGL